MGGEGPVYRAVFMNQRSKLGGLFLTEARNPAETGYDGGGIDPPRTSFRFESF